MCPHRAHWHKEVCCVRQMEIGCRAFGSGHWCLRSCPCEESCPNSASHLSQNLWDCPWVWSLKSTCYPLGIISSSICCSLLGTLLMMIYIPKLFTVTIPHLMMQSTSLCSLKLAQIAANYTLQMLQAYIGVPRGLATFWLYMGSRSQWLHIHGVLQYICQCPKVYHVCQLHYWSSSLYGWYFSPLVYPPNLSINTMQWSKPVQTSVLQLAPRKLLPQLWSLIS